MILVLNGIAKSQEAICLRVEGPNPCIPTRDDMIESAWIFHLKMRPRKTYYKTYA